MQAPVSLAIVTAIIAVLAVPGILAILRKHPNWIAITLVSALVGWTGIGWIAALWWTLRPPERRRPRKMRWVEMSWLKALWSRAGPTRRTAVRRGANDNAATPVREALVDLVPDVAADPYGDWLEQGEALAETGAVEAASKDPRATPTLAA